MHFIFTFLFLLTAFVVNAQQIIPISLVSASKQSSFSIRPEIALFSKKHAFEIELGAFNIHPKPGVSIGYCRRYRLYKSLGLELGVFTGITRFAYTAIAPKENFTSRSFTYDLRESLLNPFLSVPVLLNFQQPLNDKYLLTLFGGANFKAHFMERISSGAGFSNTPGIFPEGDIFDLYLNFQNEPINTGIILGTGIGRMLPNHNVLQLNIWANIGLKNQVDGTYLFYDQSHGNTGENIVNYLTDGGYIKSNGSSVGMELRYTLTGIRKRLKQNH